MRLYTFQEFKSALRNAASVDDLTPITRKEAREMAERAMQIMQQRELTYEERRDSLNQTRYDLQHFVDAVAKMMKVLETNYLFRDDL
ncbi:MAG: hypothetical protein HY720_08110 [Planctomycetes bacterium]|nr:hypothetical protein [Planctomycetota bacterium]